MTHDLNRRTLLKAALGSAGLGALGSLPAFAQDARIRLYWWGSKERADRTLKAGDSFVIPPGAKHDVKSVGSVPAKAVSVFVVEKSKPLASQAK